MKRISATKVHITVISQVKVSKCLVKKVDEIKTRLDWSIPNRAKLLLKSL